VALDLWEDNLWAACNTLLGLGERPKGTSKKSWIKRCIKFSDKYMDGNIKKLTYCMKDVYNWKDWVDLKNQYKKVDYTQVIEEEDNVEPEQEWACSGGKCEIV
jgi:ribonucleoside-diphosphate reductase alpha chain